VRQHALEWAPSSSPVRKPPHSSTTQTRVGLDTFELTGLRIGVAYLGFSHDQWIAPQVSAGYAGVRDVARPGCRSR
jgi:hypothetical protein